MAGKVLMIAEKESLAKQIASAFGISRLSDKGKFYENDEVIIGMASGHLYQLKPKSKILTLPYLPEAFELQYEPIAEKQFLISTLNKLLRRGDIVEVCNACDPGREGELIGSAIIENADIPFSRETRLWASSQSPSAIKTAFQKRKDASEYRNLRAAAKVRNRGDLVYGLNASRAVTQLFRRKTGSQENYSAGRVQTPTLALVVNRELDIKNFVATPFWNVNLNLSVDEKINQFTWRNQKSVLAPIQPELTDNDPEAEDQAEAKIEQNALASRIESLEIAEAIKAKVEHAFVSYTDISQTEKAHLIPAPKLFDATTLQAEADRVLGFELSKTMSVLQSLYDLTYVSYPRTENNQIATSDREAVLSAFKMLAGHRTYCDMASEVLKHEEEWVSLTKTRIFVQEEKLIDGHSAIIPTDVPVTTTLTPDQDALYSLIVKRFIAGFYPAAEVQITEQVLTINGEKFVANGQILKVKGWKEVLEVPTSSKAPLLAEIRSDSLLKIKEVSVHKSSTKPPQRYTEGKLSEMMKRLGLGTAATRAPIVNGLKGAGVKTTKAAYLQKDGKYIAPTEAGYSLINFLQSNGLSLVCEHDFTSQFEENLSGLTNGKLTETEAKDFIYQQAVRVVNTLNSVTQEVSEYKEVLGQCPSCNSDVVDTGSFKCSCTKCEFSMYKKVSGATLSVDQLKELLSGERKTHQIIKFYSERHKKSFEAYLCLQCSDGQWAVKFSFDKKEYGKCPQCGNGQVVTTYSTAIGCNVNCGFGISTKIAGHKLPEAQINKLISSGKTDVITQFHSTKKNSTFSAKVALEKGSDGKLKTVFEFENKKAR